MSKNLMLHQNWRYLLRDVCALSGLRELGKLSQTKLQDLLAAPATLAYWIESFAPHLKSKSSLRVALAGASFGQDSVDDGRWYQLLPTLLGVPDLKILIDLVGKELGPDKPCASFGGSVIQGRELNSSMAAPVAHQFPPAAVYRGTLGEYLDSRSALELPDLVFMFHPGFQEHAEEWILSGDLRNLLGRGLPVGLAAYADDEVMHEAWLLDAYGYSAGKKVLTNPFPGVAHGDDTPFPAAFGRYVLELGNRVPTEDQKLSAEAQDLNEFYESWVEHWIHDGHQFPGTKAFGWLDMSFEASEGEALISLPNGLMVGSESGEVLEIDEDGDLCELEEELPFEMLESYPKDSPLDFNRAIWSIKVVNYLSEMWAEQEDDEPPSQLALLKMAAQMAELRKQMAPPGSEAATDDRLFPFSEAEMMKHMGEFLRMATGKDVDPEDFMKSVRIGGGMHGPAHPAWYDLLTTIGWNLQQYQEKPARFQPAFITPSQREGAMLPVVCENYAYIPGDVDDELVNEAKSKLAKMYPRGVVLLFKAMLFKKVKDATYSFGGMLYWRDQWRPFALCESIDDVDGLFKQFEDGFSFNSPLAVYADQHGRLARGLNFMTHGADPNSNRPSFTLQQGDWLTPMPA